MDRQRRLGEQLLERLLDRRIDPGVAEPQLAETGLDVVPHPEPVADQRAAAI